MDGARGSGVYGDGVEYARLAAGGRSETARVHAVPGGLLVGHDQPGVPAALLHRVWSGTVSVMTSPIAVALPMLSWKMV